MDQVTAGKNRARLKASIKRKFKNSKIKYLQEKIVDQPLLNAFIVSLNDEGLVSYIIAARSKGEVKVDGPFSSKEEALVIFNQLDAIEELKRSSLVDKYNQKAKKMIVKIIEHSGTDSVDLRGYKDYLLDINFLFVVGFHYTQGFKYRSTGKFYGGTHRRTKPQDVWATGVRVMKFQDEPIVLPNQGTPNAVHFQDRIQNWIKNCVVKSGVSKRDTVKTYFGDQFFWYVMQAFEIMGPGYSKAKGVARVMYDQIYFVARRGDLSCRRTGKAIKLEGAESHKTLSPGEVRLISKKLAEVNPSVLSTFIIGLATGLRPRELERLVDSENPHAYCVGYSPKTKKSDVRSFNYKDGLLVVKTARKIDPKELSNPTIPIIASVIIKHFPYSDYKTFEKTCSELNFDIGEGFYPRRMRATLGHSYIQCERAINRSCIATHNDIKEKLGHSTTQQAQSTYAKNIPAPEMSAEAYFGIKSFAIDGQNVSDNLPLFDSFLAVAFAECLKKNKKVLMDFKNYYLAEWRERDALIRDERATDFEI